MTRSAPGAPPVRRIRPFTVLAATMRRDFTTAWSYRFPVAWRMLEVFLGLFMLFYLGRLVGDRIGAYPGGAPPGEYFAFAAVATGLVAIVHSCVTSFSTRIRTDQTTGTLETMLSTPAPAWLVVVAGAAYPMALTFVIECVSLVVAVVVFGLRLHAHAWGLVVFAVGLLATMVLFAGVGLVVAAFTIVFKRGQGAAAFIITAFALLGAVYYPLSVLPTALRVAGQILPFTWSVDLVRQTLLFGRAPLGELGKLIGLDVVIVPITIWIFGAGVIRARREGSLGQY